MWKRLLIVAAVAGALSALLVGPASARLAATNIRDGGSTGMQLLATALASGYNKSQSSAKVTVTGGGSGAGITGAANGSLDIGNSSRDPRSSDPKTLVFTKVAREPFVIAVNPGNPTTNLTLDQIKAILTGKVRSWSDVGWKQGGPIKVYGRVSTSGTFATCKALFTGGAEYRSDAPALASNALDRTAVARDTAGITCITLPYLTTAQGKIKGVQVEGVAPTLQNAASGKYTHIGTQYFVTRGNPAGAVSDYVKWVLSSTAQCSIVSKYALPIESC